VIAALWQYLLAGLAVGAQWRDAYLAAFARVAGLTLVTFDRGLRQMATGNTLLLH